MKPRWFQIHLSTAIVMMCAAAVLLGVNLKIRESSYWGYTYDGTPFETRYFKRGWPLTFLIEMQDDSLVKALNQANYWPAAYDKRALAIDVFLAINAIVIVSTILEYVLRRREAHALSSEGTQEFSRG